MLRTVKLHSTGPSRKGNPLIRELISSPIHPFPFPGNTNKALPISGLGFNMTLMVCGTPEKKNKIIVLTVFEKLA